MDHTSSLILFISAKSFLSANKHTQVSSILKKHTFPWLPLRFQLLLFNFLSLPLQTSGMNYLYMLFPSSRLPSPPQSTAVRFGPPLEEPSSRSPVTADHTEATFQSLTYSPHSCYAPPSWIFSILDFLSSAQLLNVGILLYPFCFLYGSHWLFQSVSWLPFYLMILPDQRASLRIRLKYPVILPLRLGVQSPHAEHVPTFPPNCFFCFPFQSVASQCTQAKTLGVILYSFLSFYISQLSSPAGLHHRYFCNQCFLLVSATTVLVHAAFLPPSWFFILLSNLPKV